MRTTIPLIMIFLLLLVTGVGAQLAGQDWRKAGPGCAWEFPRDRHLHPDFKTEWWYITGHLSPVDDPSAEPFGYQLTFFRSGLAPEDSLRSESAWEPVNLIMGHAAVSDPRQKKHVFSEVLWRTTPFLGGFSPKTSSGEAGSLYFSRTRMATTGTLYLGGKPVRVRGESWLDREIFTSTLTGNQKGWDWAGLRLVDGRDLMLYQLRDGQGNADFALGSLRENDGRTSPMPQDQWTLEPLEFWTSIVWRLAALQAWLRSMAMRATRWSWRLRV